jgi:hypothetical protein
LNTSMKSSRRRNIRKESQFQLLLLLLLLCHTCAREEVLVLVFRVCNGYRWWSILFFNDRQWL